MISSYGETTHVNAQQGTKIRSTSGHQPPEALYVYILSLLMYIRRNRHIETDIHERYLRTFRRGCLISLLLLSILLHACLNKYVCTTYITPLNGYTTLLYKIHHTKQTQSFDSVVKCRSEYQEYSVPRVASQLEHAYVSLMVCTERDHDMHVHTHTRHMQWRNMCVSSGKMHVFFRIFILKPCRNSNPDHNRGTHTSHNHHSHW